MSQFVRHKVVTKENPTLGQVLAKMCELSWEGHNDIDVRRRAATLTRGLASGEYMEEAKAVLQEFSPPRFRYTLDPVDHEWLQGLKEQRQMMSGDCDDIAIGINAYLMAIGHECAFVPVTFQRNGSPSHVFSLMATPHGPMVLDPVAGTETPQMLSEVRGYTIIPCRRGVDGVLRGGFLDAEFRGWSGWRKRK